MRRWQECRRFFYLEIRVDRMIDDKVRSTPSIVPISSIVWSNSSMEGAARMAIRSKLPLTECSAVTGFSRSNALNYNLTWSTDGLINEYIEPCEAIVEGKFVTVPAMEDREEFSLDGVTYEATPPAGSERWPRRWKAALIDGLDL